MEYIEKAFNFFLRQRCVIIASGFYEWQRIGTKKQPFLFHLESFKPFGFAGVYDFIEFGGEIRACAAIITSVANQVVAPIHDRMPIMIQGRDRLQKYLEPPPTHDPEFLFKLLGPFEADKMKAYRVSTLVNSTANNSPECMRPQSVRRY